MGKKEIRRLFEAHRYFVKKLVRFQIGNLQLRNIKKGGIKLLGQKDIARLILNSIILLITLKMKLIDGNKIAQSIIESLTKEVSKINGPKPTVAFIRVGEDPASVSYVRKKQKTAENIGIQSLLKILPDSISQEELIEEIEAFNDDSNVHGILIQAPCLITYPKRPSLIR